MKIKNIFWDVDGVLADLNYAYYNFLTKHPKYSSQYASIKWEDLPKVLPIVPEYGALELKTHPIHGKEMDYDFCHSLEFFTNRPLYPNVVEVLKDGPACHTGAESCFFNLIYKDSEKTDFSIDALYELIKGRKTEMQEGSYTTYLFAKGIDKIMKKVGEECTEVIIGAAKNSKEETIYEISDLAYHILVLMVEMGISVDDIRKELDSRHVIDHKVKQETMQ